MRWATAHVASTFLPANDFRTMMWDLTGFPEWVCSLKAGANAYQPLEKGVLTSDPTLMAGLGASASRDAQDEQVQLQMAIAASMAAVQSGGSTASAAEAAEAAQPSADDEMDEEERAMQEAIALSLS